MGTFLKIIGISSLVFVAICIVASSTSEGREKYIPVTGTLDEMLDDIEGGLKSACCYIGARELKNFPKCCTFYKVNNQINMKFANCKDI